jgi:DNA primase
MLLRQTDRIVFSFDGDAAGQRAAQRALEACLPLMSDDKEIRFLFLPTEHDPDSYVRTYGAPAFEKVIKEAMSFSNFFFKIVSEDHDLTSPEGRAQTHHAAKPLFLSMAPIALRSQMLREVAIRTSSTAAELEAFCGLTIAPAARSNTQAQATSAAPAGSIGRSQSSTWQPGKGYSKKPTGPVIPPPNAPMDLAEQILRLLIQFPHLGKSLNTEQRKLVLAAAEQRTANALILMTDLLKQCDQLDYLPNASSAEQAPGAGAFALFQEQLSRSELASMYEVLRKRVMESDLDAAGAAADLAGALKKLDTLQLKNEMTAITQRISSGEASDADRARYRELGERLKFS